MKQPLLDMANCVAWKTMFLEMLISLNVCVQFKNQVKIFKEERQDNHFHDM